MLRRLINLVLLIVLLGGVVSAQESPNADILRRQLSIEAKTAFFGSFNRNFGTVSLSAYQYWRYYEGFSRVSETEFLTIAGFEREARQAAQFARINTALTATAFSLLGASVGLLGVGIWASDQAFSYEFNSPERERYNDLFDVLMASALLVDLSALIPAVILIVRGENWLTLEQAVAIRDDYNSRLR